MVVLRLSPWNRLRAWWAVRRVRRAILTCNYPGCGRRLQPPEYGLCSRCYSKMKPLMPEFVQTAQARAAMKAAFDASPEELGQAALKGAQRPK